ncbi:MAG: pirin family protein [Flavobacteriales bacterium]
MKPRSIEAVLAPPAPHMVGDGFRVSNFFPSGYRIAQDRLSPFFLLDYNTPVEFGPSDRPPGVGVHPHRGFETVTFAFKGRVAHHDSAGHSGVIGEGDVQWMTAGSGVLHKEYHDAEFARTGGIFHMAQLWVNLPAKHKKEAPRYQGITKADMTEVAMADGKSSARLIAGELFGAKGPARTWSAITAAMLHVAAGGSIAFELPAEWNSVLLVVEGNAVVNGAVANEHHLVILRNEAGMIEITAAQGATLLLLSGEPLNEPIVAHGPFLMNTEDEIREALADFRAGKFGVLEE